MEKKLKKIFEQGLGDAKVQSLSWVGNDLIIDLLLPDTEKNEVLSLCFEWVIHIKIDIDFGEIGGAPMLWQLDVAERENGGFKVLFDFGGAPEGCISFECNDISQVKNKKFDLLK